LPFDRESNPYAQQIADAGRELWEIRGRWLNPPELIRTEPEVVPGFPARVLPVNEKASVELRKRTLTALYNERPRWLVQTHERLDAAVAGAYGWPSGISDEEVLKRLLELNLAGVAAQVSAPGEEEDEVELDPSP
jgi:hypothetical protein